MPKKRPSRKTTQEDIGELEKTVAGLKKREVKYPEAGGGELIIKDVCKITYPEAGGGELLVKKDSTIDTHMVELKELRPVPKVKITYPADVVKFVREMEDYDREYFKITWLDTKNRVIGVENISQGSINQAVIHPREAAKGAILANAAGVVLIHNHPSGVPEPSREDDAVVGKLKKVFDLVGIKVLDALIIAKEGYYSYTAQGRLDISLLGGTERIMENDKTELERLQSLRRIKISEMEDAGRSGRLIKRKQLLEEIFSLDKEIESLKRRESKVKENGDDACSTAMMAAMETMSKYCPTGAAEVDIGGYKIKIEASEEVMQIRENADLTYDQRVKAIQESRWAQGEARGLCAKLFGQETAECIERVSRKLAEGMVKKGS